jgi:glycosyltransferase involved in cell wall biosynthesis
MSLRRSESGRGTVKVLLATPHLTNPGGVAHYYRSVRPYLGPHIEYFAVGAGRTDTGKLRHTRRVLGNYFEFYSRLRKEAYEIVHLNPSFVPKAILRDGVLLLIAKALRKKVIVFFRGWDARCERVIRDHFSLPFRLVYSQADAFVVLAAEFEEKLHQMGLKARTIRETTVVEDAVFSQVDLEALLAQRAKQRDFRILYLSRIEASKGIYLALDAFRLLRQRHPNVTMTIAGDGREWAHAKRYAQSKGIEPVDFVGFLHGDEKHLAFARANAYFFPTFHGEGMPNAVLEAMAYGLPIVTRPVGGIADFFEDGRTGFITADSSPARFADLIERLVSDSALCGEIGRRNHRYIKEHCLASSAAARLENIYERVAGAGRPEAEVGSF